MRIADFLEDPNGDGSMVRLLALILAMCVLAVVTISCVVAIKKPAEAPGIIGAFTALVLPLVGGVWANIRERVRTDDTTTP
jgi:uncharacterized membrane protein YfbV (UPF0208 family)